MITSFGTNASRKVIATLESAGHDAVFVGGAVRDHFLDRTATDFDIATSASPIDIKRLFTVTVDIGIEHGTILVVLNGERIEVTTYRAGKTKLDNSQTHGTVFVNSLREDLQHRDFTINALALNLNGELIDLFEGVSDLQKRLIKTVGNPNERFKEDALRMLRAMRFSSVLGFDIDGATYMAIMQNANKLREVSVERIKIEMDKLWTGIESQQAIQSVADSGLADHLPLFPRGVRSLMTCAPFNSTTEGWACLMLTGGFAASEIAKAYKLSNSEKAFLSDVERAFQSRCVRLYEIEDYYRFSLDVLIIVEKVFSILYPDEKHVSEKEIKKALLNMKIRSKEDLKVTGTDLINWRNERGGQWVGESLAKIESAVLHGKLANEMDDIKEWFLNDNKREE